MKKVLALFTILSILLVIPWTIATIYLDIQFKQNVSGHLKRAADANSIELAQSELQQVVSYLDKEGLISGYTSIVYRTPDEDIGYWYMNLKTSLDDLNKVDKNASQLEKTNVLMKLRETLVDSGDKEVSVTYPKGLAKYPYNGIFALIGWIAWLGFAICVVLWLAILAVEV